MIVEERVELGRIGLEVAPGAGKRNCTSLQQLFLNHFIILQDLRILDESVR